MRVFKVTAIDGEHHILGDRYSMTKYLTIYRGDVEVFVMRTNKVLSVE